MANDDDRPDVNAAHDHGRIDQVDLQLEMQRSYLDYAMAVIIGRALPDVRDGLKPVHRRVIYGMYDGGFRPDKSFSKCARVVGEVMGQYHPHGDTAIYDALVRLVQPWSLRYPLAQGQGNFGSPGNMGAAAPRYTETKMAQLALEMVRDIEEETVDFHDNYDGAPAIYATGCSGLITHVEALPDGKYNIVLRGLEKFRMTGVDASRPYRLAHI